MTAGSEALRVVISLDVEEEGLFSGRYAAAGCTVRNVSLLPRLAPLTRDLGFPLTLLCAHTALTNPESKRVLRAMHDDLGAEIGAHLHHWSTPPLDGTAGAGHRPPPTDRVPRALLRARLRTLLDAGGELTGSPLTSFRMGRWDCKNLLHPLLAEEGILVDSSVCPLRSFPNGPDHFLAPADPYWTPCPDGRRLLEAPITQIPLHPALPRLWHRAGALIPAARRRAVLDSFHFWGALSANPVWHHPLVMRCAVRRHVARGGSVLSLFWHSSEMLPGASPNIPDQAAADALLARIRDFLVWLRTRFSVRGVTLSSLHADGLTFPTRPAGPGDW